ncbi:MAG: flagellar basal-body MS-ring/collar protein FliF [Acidobacteriota bacterium]
MDSVLKYLNQFKTTFLELSRAQKILYTGAVLMLLGSLGYLVYTSNQVEYAPLYSGMAQNDMGDVVQTLKAKKIPYRLSGNTLEVPKDQLYEIRLSLASEGIPKGSGVGFEVFDQQKLGSTEFVQKINYQRALQGELARSINEMEEVLESRVHLVMPEESLFKDEQKPPSAAVVLKLRPGAKLDQRKVQAIVNLIAGTVRGLSEDNVSIVSTDGQVLFKKSASDSPLQMSNTQMEHKTRIEEDLRQKVQSMLEQVLGSNRVLTRVSADLDFSHVQVAEETYDPDSAVVRSQQRSIENSEGKELSGKGNPDVPINVESKLMQNQPGGTDGAKGKQFNRQRETVNYEINKVSRQIVQAPGTVKKLSVAVIVDGPYKTENDANGTPKTIFVARAPEEIKSLEEIVKKAVGYSEARGDQINVSNIPFAADTGGADMVKDENQWVKMLKANQKLLINLLLTFLVFFFIVRPFMRKFQQMSAETKALSAPALAEGEGAEGGAAGLIEPPHDELPLRKRVALMVQQNPDRATEIIRAWLREEA